MSQRRTTSNRRRFDPREGDCSSSVSSTFSYPRPPSYPYPYPQPCSYPYPQPYSHPPPYPSHFIQLPVHLGMSTSGQIGELQVCMYVSILQFHHYVFPSYLSSFQYLGILLWISHIPARRDRRMIKLICRMPSCMDYMLASLYVASIDYVLLSMHYEVCMNYALFCFFEL